MTLHDCLRLLGESSSPVDRKRDAMKSESKAAVTSAASALGKRKRVSGH
ncbi:hypothetical protein [Rhodopirellula islandica]|nr:hypothetical protein [Rhodopirellula islandica]